MLNTGHHIRAIYFQVTRESKTGGVPGGVSTALAMGGSGVPNVPIIVWRCVEEVERRGLDIIGKQNILKAKLPGQLQLMPSEKLNI